MSQPKERGRPVQIVRIKEDDSFELMEKDLDRILLADHVRDKPVVVVSVAGAFRKGKSFLLDFLLRYMRSGGKEDWLGDPTAPLTGFSWRGGCNGDTMGILIWDEVFMVTTSQGKTVAVLLMDTQGAFDCRSTMKDSATIFALSAITSSVQVYNLSQNIQEDDLQKLEYFTEYGRLAQNLEQQGTQAKPFQKLVFLVRDWSCPYEHPFGAEGGSELLESRLAIYQGQPQELQTLRQRIRGYFSEIECFLMPHPGLEVATMESFDGRLSSIRKDFKLQLQDLVPSLLGPDKILVKEVNGQEITCEELMEYFKACVCTFKDGHLPDPKSVLQAMAEMNNAIAASKAKDAYKNAMENLCGVSKPALRDEDLKSHHSKEKTNALQLFHSIPKMGEKLYSADSLKRLEEDVETAFRSFKERNDEKIRQRKKMKMLQFAAAASVSSGGLLWAKLPRAAAACAGASFLPQVIPAVKGFIVKAGNSVWEVVSRQGW